MVLGSADHSLPRARRPGDARGGRAVVPRLRTADGRATRVPAGGRAPRGHLQGRTFRERHADEHPGARTSGRTGRLTPQSSNRSRGAVLMYRGPPFVMRTSSSIRTPPNPGTYTPGSSVKSTVGRSPRSLGAFSAPPSWTARPI